jgi:hypothetical protein
MSAATVHAGVERIGFAILVWPLRLLPAEIAI